MRDAGFEGARAQRVEVRPMRVDCDDAASMEIGEIDRLLTRTAADIQNPRSLRQVIDQAKRPPGRRAIAGTFARQPLVNSTS